MAGAVHAASAIASPNGAHVTRQRSLWRSTAFAAAALIGAGSACASEGSNLSELSQSGAELSASITQELAGNVARVAQSGQLNRLELVQSGGAIARLEQAGSLNRIDVEQSAPAVGAAFLSVRQDGVGNEVNVDQRDGDNGADLVQQGLSNRLDLLQLGGANTLVHTQTGDFLDMRIIQMGGASISITQSGTGN